MKILFDEWLPVTHKLFHYLRENPDNELVEIHVTTTDEYNAMLTYADRSEERR